MERQVIVSETDIAAAFTAWHTAYEKDPAKFYARGKARNGNKDETLAEYGNASSDCFLDYLDEVRALRG